MRHAVLFMTLFATVPAFARTDTAVVTEASAAHADEVAARRALQVARLRAYAEAGVFPLNHTQAGLLSQLLDASGRPCAVAHLMVLDGHGGLITDLSRSDNDVELGKQRRGPVDAWIRSSGLTHAEIAYIQEPDFFQRPHLLPEDPTATLERERLQAHFRMAAMQIEQDEAGLQAAIAAWPKPKSQP